MDAEIKTLLDKQLTAFEAVKTANDERLKALETKFASIDPLITEKIDKANKDVSKIGDELKAALAAVNRPGIETKGSDGSKLTAAEVEHKSAVFGYLKKGTEYSREIETKAMLTSDDPNGGYLLPRDLTGRVITKVFETSAMRQLASVQTIAGPYLEGPIDDDELSCGMVGEADTRTETSTPKVGMWQIPVHEGYCMPKISQRMLDDAMVDLETWIASKAAEKFGRFEAAQFVNGDGSGKARGAFSYTPAVDTTGSRASKTVFTAKTGVNGDLTDADKCLHLIMGLKAPYRANGKWQFSRQGIEKIRLLKQDGKYLWTPTILPNDASLPVGLQAGTFMGYPVVENNDLAAWATGNIVGGFGDWREFYQIVDRQGIRVLRDNVTAKGFVLFYMTKRWGGAALNFESAGYLQASA